MKSAENPEQLSATKASEALPTPTRGMRFTYPTGSRPLDGYTVKRGIGIGGFGEVYFAVSDAGKEVALKRIQRNVEVELRGVSQCLNLKHSNLITLWDIKQDDHGEGWVIMEYVPGRNLRDAINEHEQGMPLEKALQWFESIASGVDYLHDHGIVHRDLKPGNVFIDEAENLVKIGDYGLSKFISCSRREGQTESVGTFHYMAPEIGKGVYGKEIDIYALGVILCEMLTGNVPFDGESSQEIIMKHLTADPYLGSLQEPYNSVIRKALAKSPERRFSSTKAMVDALRLPPQLRGSSSHYEVTPPRSQGGVSSPLSRWQQSNFGTNNANTPPAGKDNLLFIGHDEATDEIVLGELKEFVQAEVVDAGPVSAAGSPSQQAPAHPEASIHPTAEVLDKDPRSSQIGALNSEHKVAQPLPGSLASSSHPHTSVTDAPNLEGAFDVPAPKAGWFGKLQSWHGSRTLTFIKALFLVVSGLLLLSSPDFWGPVFLISAAIYAVYFGILSFIKWCRRSDENVLIISDSNDGNPISALEAEDQILRKRLFQRGTPVRVMELTGSMLSASLIVAAVGLLAMAIRFRSLAFSIESVSFFLWLALTGSLASWSILLLGRVWETVRGDALRRRLILLMSGLFVGGLSFGIAEMLMVDMNLTNPLTVDASGAVSIASHPHLASFLIYFGGLFVIMRWWRQADPIRQVRLNLMAIGLCCLWSFVFNQFGQFSLPWGILVGGMISFAVQVSAKHFASSDRQQLLVQPDRILL